MRIERAKARPPGENVGIAPSEPTDKLEHTIYLDAVNGAGGLLAPFEGLFEAQFDVGDEIETGQTAGILYSLDEVDRPPKELLFTDSGIVCVKHVTARVVHGSDICRTAKPVSRDKILALANN